MGFVFKAGEEHGLWIHADPGSALVPPLTSCATLVSYLFVSLSGKMGRMIPSSLAHCEDCDSAHTGWPVRLVLFLLFWLAPPPERSLVFAGS